MGPDPDATEPKNQEIDAPVKERVPPPRPNDATDYKVYTSPADIAYTPEHALQEGSKMVNKLASSIQVLQLGPRRKEVWLRDTTSLRSQGAPSTLIAVCGATGAGKSSILNAILDDNIVPTSGMRACTAVVTEIAHHKKKTIDADVSFLSKEEWKAELQILLSDLVEEDGTLKRSTDLKSDAGVAWHKVHAVYPTLSQERLVTMTPDQIIAKDPKIEKILQTKNIVAKNSKAFAIEIAKYIDSKDQRRGKDKEKKKDKDANTPALWPLIRQVNVRCSAAALATGAILVDLPGKCDDSIAKEYMKKANCIWILAPIMRAVDSKIAKDLLGDAFRNQLMSAYTDTTITFIATKCDDVSCTEIIQALPQLHDDPQLDEIQEKIERIADETTETKKQKAAADKLEQLECFEDDKPFVPRLTAKNKEKRTETKPLKGTKRKNSRGGKRGSPKRRRSESVDRDGDEDDKMDDSDSDLFKSDSDRSDVDSDEEDKDDSDNDSDEEQDSDREKNSDRENSDHEDSDHEDSDREDSNIDVDEIEEEVTAETIKHNIAEAKKPMDDARQRLNGARKLKKEALDHLATLKKKATTAQKDKNAFCSLKRSEYSRDVLKEDFRTGLKDLDEAAAEERDPANFDPSVPIRDYSAIDLPVFTVSSRDYVRIKQQVKGDGEPICFSNVRDTGIPELQAWCHQLTKSSRERAAKTFMKQLGAFASDIRQYVAGIGQSLREKWESGEQDAPEPIDEQDPFTAILGGTARSIRRTNRYHSPPHRGTPKAVDEFGKVVETSVESLKEHLRDGLEERCRIGAASAAEAAVPTSDDFASSMHWASYRATLRRNGEYRRDLNVELVNPFTRNIAQTWQKTFEADIFSPLLDGIIACINKVVGDVERSAAPGLKALDKTMSSVKEALNNEQKEVSRSLAPHVQSELIDGYSAAMEERGLGSVARQKASFRSYIVGCKDDIFEEGADVILEKLTGAADAVGRTLTVALSDLAEKCEVNLAVLWEGVRDDPAQVTARSEIVTEVNRVLEQVQFFSAAENARHVPNEDTVME
ncbi:hypothetical protein B0H14DRAFT_3079313 [Mycena olivaceomarginata]|nr:hypothetical protein B0H14DRAFT_3079313 [Mycena olivaceomarginata]